jgi:uncharacterized protein YciI
MLFVMIGHDGPGGKALRPSLRPSHLDHVRRFQSGGHVVLAGPLTDGAGSLLVVDFDTIDDARAMADVDPYFTGGVFERVDIHPFLKVFPEGDAR